MVGENLNTGVNNSGLVCERESGATHSYLKSPSCCCCCRGGRRGGGAGRGVIHPAGTCNCTRYSAQNTPSGLTDEEERNLCPYRVTGTYWKAGMRKGGQGYRRLTRPFQREERTRARTLSNRVSPFTARRGVCDCSL